MLGSTSAKEMKLLRVGVEVNHIKTESQSLKVTAFPAIPNLLLKFDIDESVTPRQDFRYDIPESLEMSLNADLEKLEKQDIIEPAPTTPRWVSRIKAVTKANGEIRWVVMMLGPNKAIRRVYYPMPTMDKLAVRMAGAKFFSKLDIKNAYFHVKLEEESKELTTFMTSKGPMRFKRLAFGVNCVPEAFQKIMEDLLRGCDGVVVFIDDILIYATSLDQLRERTAAALIKVDENNLTLNNDKCVYEKMEIEFLGFRINKNGMRPTDDKIKDVIACERPASVTQVRSFLGMVTFMGSFIENLSELTESLRKLTVKNQPFIWNAEQEIAFEKIKDVVANHVKTRGFFNGDDETWLCTDASPVGLGAVLVQEGGESPGSKKKRIIAFASKALTKTEAAYPQTQREALAVVWAVEKFHFYLIGRDFHLLVDHQPLAYIFNGEGHNNKRATTRAEAWAQRLGTYRFNVEVIKGEENIADYLSRKSLLNKIPFNDQEGPHELGALTVHVNPLMRNGYRAVTNEEMKMATDKDEVLRKVGEALETSEWTDELVRFGAFKDELRMQDGLLLRGHQIVAAVAMRGRLMRAAHLGHPGIVSMKRTLRNSVWWPKMDADIEEHVKQCMGCTIVSRCDPPEPMTRTELPSEPWEFIAIDFHSPNSLGVKLIVIVDYFSRMICVRVMKETDAERTCDQLEDLFTTFGYPTIIKADNGPPFQSQKFKDWASSRDIKIVHSTPAAPWMNGEVETQMRGIGKNLIIAVAQKENWQVELSKYVFAYNRRVHPVTGQKPVELFFKRKVRDLMPVDENADQEGPLIGEVRDRDKLEKFRGKIAGDKRRRAKESSLAIGDLVLMENRPATGLQPRFNTTPFKIIEKKGGTVTIQNENGQIFRRSTCQVKRLPGAEKDNNDQDEKMEEAGDAQEKGGAANSLQGTTPAPSTPVDSESTGTPTPEASIANSRHRRQIVAPKKYQN